MDLEDLEGLSYIPPCYRKQEVSRLDLMADRETRLRIEGKLRPEPLEDEGEVAR